MKELPPPLIRHDVQPLGPSVRVTSSINGNAQPILWDFPTMAPALRFVAWLTTNRYARPMVYVSGNRVSDKHLRGMIVYHTAREAGEKTRVCLGVDTPIHLARGVARVTVEGSAPRTTHVLPTLA